MVLGSNRLKMIYLIHIRICTIVWVLGNNVKVGVMGKKREEKMKVGIKKCLEDSMRRLMSSKAGNIP